tara:strand:- start:1111 stop:1683 length:573 start_codon:yes stop_codon:yes gene_type:complete
MKQYEYKDYNEYVDSQKDANREKQHMVYVEQKTINKVASDKGIAHNIMCHGTRRAVEQQFFKICYPDANIIGTEVGIADKWPMTIQHDFNLQKEEWIGHFDIVYSNSFDHVFDPIKTLTVWADQLSPNGRIYLEHGYGDNDNRARPWDPLEINDNELRDLFNRVGLKLVSTFDSTGLKGREPSKVYVLER